MTDYELITMIKTESNEEAKIMLWEKYIPKVKSTYFRNRSFFNSIGLLMDDFVQEAYFSFEDALAYVDLEKMERSKSNFGTSFYWFLLKLKNSYVRKESKNSRTVYISELYKDELDFQYNLRLEFENKSSFTLSDEIEKREVFNLVHTYINNQNDRNKNILQWYLEGKTIREISDKSGIPYTTIRNYIMRAKTNITKLHVNSLA